MVQAQNQDHPHPAARGPLPVVPGVPPEDMAVLLRLLAAPEGTTAALAGLALGKSKSLAHEYLTALRDRNIAKLTGGGRGSRFRLIQQETAPRPQAYTTIEDLADAVHDGLVEADDDARQVLEEVRRIARRPHLTVVQGGGGAQ
jgi:hypothetical protein